MSFTVSIHKDANLAAHVKYRNSFPAAALYTTTAVNIGNFSNLNLFVDNTVELGMGRETPPASTYQLATEANYIKIVWGAYTTIGYITDWEYINDSNVKISYAVDAYMSAIVSGVIDEAKGLCDRTNFVTGSFKDNLQSEPFSPSDNMEANATLTAAFNALAQACEQMSPSWDGINSGDTRLILTVSPAIVEYTNTAAWGKPPLSGTVTLRNRATMMFYQADATTHAGGTFRGTPLKFDNIGEVYTFIRWILSGCGFRTQLSSNGQSGQNATSYNSYITDSNTGGGQSQWQYRNSSGDPMESLRFITIQDIYNLYCIPSIFAQGYNGYPNELQQIRGFKSIGNLHKWGGEDSAKLKLMAHPYYYCKVVTANGDTTNIIPQTHYNGDEISHFVNVWVRFIGGDTPRLQGLIGYSGTGQGSPLGESFCGEWFTVRNYPAVTLSINDSFNPQVQKDVGNARKIAATYANAAANARLSNPVKQGYWDAVRGDTDHAAHGAGYFGTGIGEFLGGGALGATNTSGFQQTGGGLFKDTAGTTADNAARDASAGNFISPEVTSIMGNDFMAQYSVPAFAVFDCGATDAEMWAFSRYIDEFGQACNSIINPITNAGTVLGGAGTITPVDGRTFYQFTNITVKGNMPIAWRDNIKNLFESGVYLVDA